ncbi:MAG: hypothetical protein HRT45_10740 [Bdellovibrionales bacterium]|nr:hypothetical protein [Bdellovibrionales bacterium]
MKVLWLTLLVLVILPSLAFADKLSPEEIEAKADRDFKIKTEFGGCVSSKEYMEGAFACHGEVKIDSNASKDKIKHAQKIATGRLWRVIIDHCKTMKSEPEFIPKSRKRSAPQKVDGKFSIKVSGAFYCSGI